MHPHPSFPHERHECCCLQINEGRRSAEKRNTGAASADAARALRSARSPSGAPPRLWPRFLGLGFSTSGQVSWDVVRRDLPALSCPSPAAAPRAPVVVPADMMPEAARERFARPPAGTAPAPHLQIASGMRPSMGGLSASLTKQRRVSRTNEFAISAFVSDGKHVAFSQGAADFGRRARERRRQCARHSRKDSLAQRKAHEAQ
jgi:hypothetical protein